MEMKNIIEKLNEIDKKQDKILALLHAKTANNITKLDVAETFFRNCRLDKIPLSKAPDLLYPSIYSTREHAIKAIKTLQMKGLLAVQGNMLLIKKKEVKPKWQNNLGYQ